MGYIDNARKNGMGKIPAFFATRAITSGLIKKKKVMREVNGVLWYALNRSLNLSSKSLRYGSCSIISKVFIEIFIFVFTVILVTIKLD